MDDNSIEPRNTRCGLTPGAECARGSTMVSEHEDLVEKISGGKMTNIYRQKITFPPINIPVADVQISLQVTKELEQHFTEEIYRPLIVIDYEKKDKKGKKK
jgi:hypothetical protein